MEVDSILDKEGDYFVWINVSNFLWNLEITINVVLEKTIATGKVHFFCLSFQVFNICRLEAVLDLPTRKRYHLPYF